MSARIGVRISYKINLGNYEMMDVDITVEDNALPGETANQTFDRLYNFVEGKVADKVKAEKEGL